MLASGTKKIKLGNLNESSANNQRIQSVNLLEMKNEQYNIGYT